MHPRSVIEVPTVTAHLVARLCAKRLDQQLAVGAIPHAGSALALHSARIRSVRERHAVARVLRRIVEQSRSDRAPGGSKIHRANVRASADLIDAITLRLHAPHSVDAMGMARLRRILSDGRGPLYHGNAGDLVHRLAAAFAAL
ncbi:hypothetical protein AU197_25325 [Mycobacterium sp. IS-1590]|uniref:hypothetical protein n=1 Tax=Mycobacterium sp. IS-1590 TaxID=1772286 RepID=UPI0007486A89|nr:hypothetical protein [Mycobacterium sp. IS-1590]KUI43252.1 hypothetical protein AU197_25325 [Mycobacterium sp. IS-1590]